MEYSYTDYTSLDPAKRQQFREIMAKNPEHNDHIKFLVDMYQNDPDSNVRQWALDMLGKLGIGITDQQTLTLTTPDHKLIELNTDKGRVYAPSELKNQSLYLVAPKTSRTFLNGETVNLPRGDRYASFFANGKLLLGQVLGAGMEKTPSNWRGNFPKYLVCYSFLTPEGKLVVGEHGDLNEKQYRDRPAPGTAVAVLYVNHAEYEIL